MSFVTGKDVMKKVESMIKTLWDDLDWSRRYIGMDGKDFRVMTYAEAMRDWGSDKPDLRFDMKVGHMIFASPFLWLTYQKIHNITNVVPQELKSNLTSIHNPIIDALKVSATQEPQKSRDFVKSYMDRPASARFRDSSHGAPGVFIIDSSKPLQGLHALGFEAAGKVIELLNLKDGDVLVLQARPPHPLFVGGSTRLGDLRLSLQKFAEYKELVPKRTGYAFLWVVDFPLFTPLSWDDSGGISPEFTSTHHPFTSPKSTEDVDLLRTKPLLAKADHYDLVMNGVELGGGSRRIHQAEFQHYIFKDLLKLRSSKLHQFDHLLSALATGCPPHAGFALGFDRLIAVMLDRPSLRDVIAFPKWTIESRDLTVRSPGAINEEDLKEYHLRLRESTPWEDSRARKLGPDGNPLRDATVLRSLEL
jgi:aspartyl-tRNA synthetase